MKFCGLIKYKQLVLDQCSNYVIADPRKAKVVLSSLQKHSLSAMFNSMAVELPCAMGASSIWGVP